jgi:hypothetical protein
MTTMTRPKFMDSEYFVLEFGNWHLKPGAPPEVVKEFDEWMAEYNKTPVGQEAQDDQP